MTSTVTVVDSDPAGTTTLAFYYAKQGLDWEVQMEQQFREVAKRLVLQEKYDIPDDGDDDAE